MTALKPHLPRSEILHDFLGAAADRIDLDLAVDALDLDAAHEAGAAKDLHCFRRAIRHGLRRLIFHHADLGDRAFALYEPPCQHFQHGLRGRNALRHVYDLVADHLMLRDRLAECLTFLGIGDRFIDADAGIGGAACSHAHALAIEIEHDLPEALPLLADQVFD